MKGGRNGPRQRRLERGLYLEKHVPQGSIRLGGPWSASGPPKTWSSLVQAFIGRLSFIEQTENSTQESTSAILILNRPQAPASRRKTTAVPSSLSFSVQRSQKAHKMFTLSEESKVRRGQRW